MRVLLTAFFRTLASRPEKAQKVFKCFFKYLLCFYWLAGISQLPSVLADATKEQQVKVSFIYNFAQFIKWPESVNSGRSFIICVIGTQPLSSSIDLLKGRFVNGLTIDVRLVIKPELEECQILFIGDSEAQRLPELLQDIAAAPVLSISDMPDFVHAGGIIGMKLIDDRVRFDINLLAAQKAGLSINSQLLKLATEVLQ